ncbi:MAG: DUF4373 domain-containing protein [Gorillibacterium sp.]|nr:DUF4373 domain-containing protein [Gorillibacterium sp.]
MKKAYFFSHDSNARHDPKILPMRGVYGPMGYGWYWILVEMMRDQEGYKLGMQGKYIWNAYAQELGCKSNEEAKAFIMDCINEFELFQTDGNHFWSSSLIRRMGNYDKIVTNNTNAANARWGKEKKEKPEKTSSQAESMHSHMQTHIDSNAIVLHSDEENHANGMLEDIRREEKILEDIRISATISGGLKVDADFGTVFREYSKNFIAGGKVTQFDVEDFQELYDTYDGEWALKAMREAYRQGPDKRNLAYVNGILKRWKKVGLDNPWEVEKLRGGQPDEKIEGGGQGIQSGNNSTKSSDSITGGQTGWLPSSRSRPQDPVPPVQ